MGFNQMFPEILVAYVQDRECTLSNSQCNELSKYVTGLEQAERAAYLKALDDARAVVDAEFDRWLADEEAEYPCFTYIHDGFDQLKSAYKEGEHDQKSNG